MFACLCVHTCVERCGGWKVCVERGKRVRVRVSLGFNKGSDVAVVAIAILNESLSCSRSIDSRCSDSRYLEPKPHHRYQNG